MQETAMSISQPVAAQIRTAHAMLADFCPPMHHNAPSEASSGAEGATQNSRSLTPEEELAIGHLLAGRSYTEIARMLQVDRSTLYRWRQQPAFQARLAELSAEALEAIAMRTRNLLLRGTAKLEQFLERTATFSDTLRLVSNKRIWDIARTLPGDPSEADQTSASSADCGRAAP